MDPEQDFRRLLEKFGELRVRADVEYGLYSPVRLAWARAWLTDKAAGPNRNVVELPFRAAESDTALTEMAVAPDASETRRLAADSRDLAAEAARLAREAKAIARTSKASAMTARLVAVLAAAVAVVTVVASVALFEFHIV